MNNKVIEIDLSKYKNGNAKFIVGIENGANARINEQLDDLVKKYENNEISKIKFITSTQIYGVVSSFILGMLSEIITKINNKKEVYNIFDFNGLTKELQQQFDEEIDYILGA